MLGRRKEKGNSSQRSRRDTTLIWIKVLVSGLWRSSGENVKAEMEMCGQSGGKEGKKSIVLGGKLLEKRALLLHKKRKKEGKDPLSHKKKKKSQFSKKGVRGED